MRASELLLEAKSLIRRILRIPDPWKVFRDLERRIHPTSWAEQQSVLDWLRETAPTPGAGDRPALDPTSSNPLVRRFADRWAGLERQFRGKHAGLAADCRVLFYLPSFGAAPAPHSLIRNLGAGLTFCGIPVAYWDEGTALAGHLERFRPTVLLSLDRVWYGPQPEVGQDAVEAVREYRRGRKLIFGLTYNQFPEDRAVLSRQLVSAAALGVNFFVSYLAPPAVRARYVPFVDRGFPVFSLEFGANPVLFHPVPGVERDLNFVYLASTNFEKWERVAAFLNGVFRDYPGVIFGPGWPRAVVAQLPDHQLGYLYARAKVGINLHVPFQIEDATELNERAYNLGASGVPQLMDNPALLPDRFGPKSIYSAATPDEYHQLFRHMLAHPDEAAERAANAMDDVLERHTVFHRADHLVEQLRQFDGTGSHRG